MHFTLHLGSKGRGQCPTSWTWTNVQTMAFNGFAYMQFFLHQFTTLMQSNGSTVYKNIVPFKKPRSMITIYNCIHSNKLHELNFIFGTCQYWRALVLSSLIVSPQFDNLIVWSISRCWNNPLHLLQHLDIFICLYSNIANRIFQSITLLQRCIYTILFYSVYVLGVALVVYLLIDHIQIIIFL